MSVYEVCVTIDGHSELTDELADLVYDGFNDGDSMLHGKNGKVKLHLEREDINPSSLKYNILKELQAIGLKGVDFEFEKVGE